MTALANLFLSIRVCECIYCILQEMPLLIGNCNQNIFNSSLQLFNNTFNLFKPFWPIIFYKLCKLFIFLEAASLENLQFREQTFLYRLISYSTRKVTNYLWNWNKFADLLLFRLFHCEYLLSGFRVILIETQFCCRFFFFILQGFSREFWFVWLLIEFMFKQTRFNSILDFTLVPVRVKQVDQETDTAMALRKHLHERSHHLDFTILQNEFPFILWVRNDH